MYKPRHFFLTGRAQVRLTEIFRPVCHLIPGKGGVLDPPGQTGTAWRIYEIFAITGSILKYHCDQSFYGRRHPIYPERADRQD
jgi:hypothetical protein